LKHEKQQENEKKDETVQFKMCFAVKTRDEGGATAWRITEQGSLYRPF